MPTLQQKLEELLRTQLKDGQADLETLANGSVCGHVISSEFEGLSYGDRRNRIRRIVEESRDAGKFEPDELAHISTLLTYTPAEWTVALTDI